MEAFVIEGPCRLEGTVEVSGSKNSALPLLFASLLFDDEVRYENVPRLWDIETTLSLLGSMGAESSWDKEAGTLSIFPKIHSKEASYDWVRKMRAGVLALAPLVAKYGEARVSLPGGCAIGARPVDFHLEAMQRMGIDVEVSEGYINAKVRDRIRPAHLIFPKVTVTGTENLMILACFADGESRIENAACEPEVVALGEFLIQLGAKIRGLGTNMLEVRGGPLSRPIAPVKIPYDRIESATWLAAAVATRSPLRIKGCAPRELTLVIESFRKMGAGIEVLEDGRTIEVLPKDIYRPVSVETAPFPGFPTDMQAQMLVAMTQANGVSQLRETVFENRFMHVAELNRMGARIETDGTLATVTGRCILQGAPVMATDLRASASLVLAGLCAKGKTTIRRIYHLDRGYQRLDQKLSLLGARVERVKDSD